jgi:PKD repeat protein
MSLVIREEVFMSLLPSSRRRGRAALVLAAAASVAAAAAGCDRNPGNPFTPTGNGGTLAAEISASATSGHAPIDITFTSNVHGGDGAYRYEWSFGDGRTSAAANPRVQFVSGGNYDVRLQVSSGDDTVTAGPLSVRLDSDVRLSCSADPEEAQAPVTVSFRAAPSGGTGAFTYRWDFGDGTSSTDASPVHTYVSPGSYREVLTVASGGASSICAHTVTVYGDFRLQSCKATPMGSRTVQFHATPSFCLFDDCTYEWNFGGTGSGRGLLTARPLFTYDASGTYTATLSASTQGRGNTASCQVTVTAP